MKFTIILSVILFIFTGFMMSNNKQDHNMSKGEQLVNNILAKTAKIIEKKYNIKPSGTGAAMPGGPIQELTLCFNTRSPNTKEQLRYLLIKSAHELQKQVIENKDIQEFLKERPFKISNIQIIIYNCDKNGREIYDPAISTAEISHDRLNYNTIDPNDSFKYKSEYEESYQDALKLLQDLIVDDKS